MKATVKDGGDGAQRSSDTPLIQRYLLDVKEGEGALDTN